MLELQLIKENSYAFPKVRVLLIKYSQSFHLSYLTVVQVLSSSSLICPLSKYQFGYLSSRRGYREQKTILPLRSDKNRLEEN